MISVIEPQIQTLKQGGQSDNSDKMHPGAPINVLGVAGSMIRDAIEERLLRDQIDKLSHESDYVLDMINKARKENQKKLFLTYQSFLEQIIDSVDHRIAV
jgi:hypothetical protein